MANARSLSGVDRSTAIARIVAVWIGSALPQPHGHAVHAMYRYRRAQPRFEEEIGAFASINHIRNMPISLYAIAVLCG